jgi:hypothetical protein
MAITKIPAAGFTGNNFRNIIINGDMSIAQRGTSVSSISSGGTYNTVDRFRFALGTAGTWTQSQDTDVPSGQGFAKSLKMDCTTANASLSAGSYMNLQYKFEGQNLQYLKKGTANAESTTLSFWVKSNKTGTYNIVLRDTDNSREIGNTYTIDSASTWEKKTITFAGDTSGAFDNDNSASLTIFFWLAAGTTYSSGTTQTSWGSVVSANEAVGQVNLADSTANEWYITGVQLEAGTSASDFEFLPHDVNLERCQRYFISYGGDNSYETFGFGMCYSTTEALVNVPFPTTMRSSPSVSTENLANYASRSGSQTGGAPSSLVNDFSSTKVGNIQLAGLSSMTDKNALRLYTNNSTANRLEFSAEL